MADPTQTGRSLAISTPLGANALLLIGLRGVEALNRLFEFHLDLLAPAGTQVPFDQLIGQPAGVVIQPDGEPRRFIHGIIRRIARGRSDAAFTAYSAVLVPAFWTLTKQTQSRLFQQQTVPEILHAVLTGLDTTFELTGTYPARNYCVQYQETDFAFACRLMEEEGISYFFRHNDSGHVLVLTDHTGQTPTLPGGAVPYDDGQGGLRGPRVTAFEVAQEFRAGAYAVRDRNFALPSQALPASQLIEESATAGSRIVKLRLAANAKTTLYDHPGGYAKRFDAVSPSGGDQSSQLQSLFTENARVARLRMEAEASESVSASGESLIAAFTPGNQFTLEKNGDGDGTWLLTEVEHAATLDGDYRSGGSHPLTYTNRFRATPPDLPVRPPRVTPRPVIAGFETATVVGPPGQEIFTDKFGRVKVAFYWDAAGSQSCWLRVAQNWAGNGWGAVTVPRVGQEVIVGFRAGDPDEPLVLGSVYNTDQMPPFPLPENSTQSGFKTHTHNSTDPAQFSGLAFEDAADGEHVHLHSERFMTHSTEGTLFVNAGNQHHVNIGRVATRQVGGLHGLDHSLTTGAGAAPSGSGSGGGAATPAQFGPFGWNPASAGGLAADLDAVVGWRRVDTLGLYSIATIGQMSRTVINPLGYPEVFGVELPLTGVPGLFAGTSILNADTTVVIGGMTNLHYGNTVVINRGSKLTSTGPQQGIAGRLACRAAAMAYSASVVVEAMAPMIDARLKMPNTLTNELVAGFTYAGVTEALMSVWATLEAKTNAAEVAVKGVSASNGVPKVAAQDDPGLASRAVNAITSWVGDQLFGDLNFGLGMGATGGSSTEMADSTYAITAPAILLVSAPPATSTTASLISLQAIGTAEEPGDVVIQAGATSHIAGGAMAYGKFSTDDAEIGTVIVDCGEDGTITLQSGIAKEPNHLTLSPEGITVQSLELITLTVEDSTVEIDAEGITLTAAESVVEITPEAIVLSCGASSIEISAEGIVLNGPTVTIAADAETTLSSAAVMITE